MKKSWRTKRMEKNHRRMSQSSKLNLVSLMDIFTILVFFLLINSSDVEVLSSDKSIQLPESHAEQKPETTLLIKVNDQDLIVGSRAIAKVTDIIASNAVMIDALTKELQYQAQRRGATAKEKEKGRAVTIMGDQGVPYELLKRIMTTCAVNDFRDISLAVNQIATSTQVSGSALPVSGAQGAKP